MRTEAPGNLYDCDTIVNILRFPIFANRPATANIGTFLKGIWCPCNELCLWCNIWPQFRPNPLTKLISFRMFVRTSSRMLHKLPRADLCRLGGGQPNPDASLRFV